MKEIDLLVRVRFLPEAEQCSIGKAVDHVKKAEKQTSRLYWIENFGFVKPGRAGETGTLYIIQVVSTKVI